MSNNGYKIYISGKITGLEGYKKVFKESEEILVKQGFSVLNPSVLPPRFDYGDYMRICYTMIDVCDAIFMMSNWEDSKGAVLEKNYAEMVGKAILYEIEEGK